MTTLVRRREKPRSLPRIYGLGIAIVVPLVSCGDDAPGTGESGGSSGATTEATTCGSGGSGAGTGGAGTGGAGTGATDPSCMEGRERTLGRVNAVSMGQVTILEQAGGVTKLFVDASAGGIINQLTNPWVYIDFAMLARVEVTDIDADTSTEWDLAIKRPILRVNSGDGGLA